MYQVLKVRTGHVPKGMTTRDACGGIVQCLIHHYEEAFDKVLEEDEDMDTAEVLKSMRKKAKELRAGLKKKDSEAAAFIGT